MKMTDSEWAVMEVLWQGESFSLGEVAGQLKENIGWSKTTVQTYLKRMEKKGLVSIDKGRDNPYSAAVKRDDCAREERNDLLSRVYDGAAGDLISAYIRESSISKEEIEKLRKLLDEMEV